MAFIGVSRTAASFLELLFSGTFGPYCTDAIKDCCFMIVIYHSSHNGGDCVGTV